MTAASHLLEARQLVKIYGGRTVVDRVNFHVGRGEIVGLLGRNGAGKSTTMKMLTGFLEPDSGSARIAGYDVLEQPKLAKAKLGYLPEGAPLYAEMTPRKLLQFVAALRGYEKHEATRRAGIAVERAGLEPVLDRTIETLSKGFKRRVGLAQAILHDPPVLVMDEPTDGLDPNQKHSVRKLIQEMASQKAIIISTHLLEEVEAVCTRAVIIDKGRIVADGTPAELLARSRHHNAVTLTLPLATAEPARAAIQALSNVLSVEQTAQHDGLATITAFPKASALIIEDITQIAVSHNWDVKQFYAEAGRLDEVFRALTTRDTEVARERRQGAAP
jgi:ABC-2 type transport system ATP-binding protein